MQLCPTAILFNSHNNICLIKLYVMIPLTWGHFVTWRKYITISYLSRCLHWCMCASGHLYLLLKTNDAALLQCSRSFQVQPWAASRAWEQGSFGSGVDDSDHKRTLIEQGPNVRGMVADWKTVNGWGTSNQAAGLLSLLMDKWRQQGATKEVT